VKTLRLQVCGVSGIIVITSLNFSTNGFEPPSRLELLQTPLVLLKPLPQVYQVCKKKAKKED
jgi:hypothetical protein